MLAPESRNLFEILNVCSLVVCFVCCKCAIVFSHNVVHVETCLPLFQS